MGVTMEDLYSHATDLFVAGYRSLSLSLFAFHPRNNPILQARMVTTVKISQNRGTQESKELHEFPQLNSLCFPGMAAGGSNVAVFSFHRYHPRLKMSPMDWYAVLHHPSGSICTSNVPFVFALAMFTKSYIMI